MRRVYVTFDYNIKKYIIVEYSNTTLQAEVQSFPAFDSCSSHILAIYGRRVTFTSALNTLKKEVDSNKRKKKPIDAQRTIDWTSGVPMDMTGT
jgi:hypothetical protein